MEKTLYRVGETANLKAFPRGTKIGDEIELTEAQALYERDMGRIEPVEAPAEDGSEAQTDPGDGIVKTPVEGDALVVTDPSPVKAMPLTTENADRLADEVGAKPRALRKI